ncbi:MAG: IS66 family transposase [Candidatus Binatia bacterium]
MAEPDERAYEMKRLEEEVRLQRGTIDYLEALVEGLQYELHMRGIRLKEKDQHIAELEQRVHELSEHAAGDSEALPPPPSPPALPAFVKANVPRRRRRKKPGRKNGHEGAFRPMPAKIDHHQEVPLGTDATRRPVCPHCQCRLAKLRRHKRIVEDLIRSAVKVTCYHTHSGRCPNCRRRVESRAPEQPPAANVASSQLGLNALTTAAILRVRHRLPFRRIAELVMDLAQLRVSPGGIVKQVKRLARWLDGKYRDLIRRMRASPHVNADETGWRIDGRNFWLWAFTDPTFTLYHVDASRGGKVPLRLLGKAFGGTTVCDFYSAYNALGGEKQRCLTHLMREVRELKEADTTFAACPLSRRLMRWCKEALRLKKQWKTLDDDRYELCASRLEDRLDALARAGQWDHPDAQRLAGRLTRHRNELTRFLWDEKLDGTNNAAERALRPAVVMRKTTGGSRSEAGAQAWAKVASLLRTADQQGLGVFEATQKLVMEYWAGGGR